MSYRSRSVEGGVQGATLSNGRKVRRLFILGAMPLFMIPFIILYSWGALWLKRILNDFPGGFFRRHEALTVVAVAVLAVYLLVVTGSVVWEKLKARL